MEKQIPVTVNDLPENTTGLEVVSFETGIDEFNDPYLSCVIKNVSNTSIRVWSVDIYYLDSSKKIIGEENLYCGTVDGISRNLAAGEEFETGISGGIRFPENTVELLIYNRKMY